MADDLSEKSQKQRGMTSPAIADDGNLLSVNKILNPDGPAGMNLHLSPEIQEYASREEHFRFALSGILGIIEERLRAIDSSYRVEVKLEIDPLNPKEEHSDIIVRVREKDHKCILDLWDDVGSSVGCFLKSLRDGSTMPESAAIGLYDFINVIFSPDA